MFGLSIRMEETKDEYSLLVSKGYNEVQRKPCKLLEVALLRSYAEPYTNQSNPNLSPL